jgi:hypothetical protein
MTFEIVEIVGGVLGALPEQHVMLLMAMESIYQPVLATLASAPTRQRN